MTDSPIPPAAVHASATSSNLPSVPRLFLRLLYAASVVAIALAMVLPTLPKSVIGERAKKLLGKLSQAQLNISVKEGWRMYAPDPQRAQLNMTLTAVYPDKTKVELVESQQEKTGWGTKWFWDKTRLDIWQQYANFHPKGGNRNRTWFLKGICVRESRDGRVPHRIVMHHVTRGFRSPESIRKHGGPGLGRPRRALVTVQYCTVAGVKAMIHADWERRGIEAAGVGTASAPGVHK